jgi:hypothetical protein
MFLCLIGALLSQLLLAKVHDRQLQRLPTTGTHEEDRD